MVAHRGGIKTWGKHPNSPDKDPMLPWAVAPYFKSNHSNIWGEGGMGLNQVHYVAQCSTAVSSEAWAKLREWAVLASQGQLLLSGSVVLASLKAAVFVLIRNPPEIPAHDRVFQIFRRRMIMAAKWLTSPANRNMFIVNAGLSSNVGQRKGEDWRAPRG